MATYNGSRFIRKQIGSILSQLSENDELIISDDNSTDDTREIICSIGDNRVKLLIHNKLPPPPLLRKSFIFNKICRNNFAATANFENALSHATGDYIFLADHDDIWVSNKIEATISAFEQNPQIALVISDLNVIDVNDEIVWKSSHNRHNRSFLNQLKLCQYFGCTMAIKKDLLSAALPFPVYTVSHDNWLGLLAEWNHSVYVINESLLLYRRHGTNITHNIKNPLWFKIWYRLYYVYAIIKRQYFSR